jgi:hypothetical protein
VATQVPAMPAPNVAEAMSKNRNTVKIDFI